MRIRVYNLIVLVLLVAAIASRAKADSTSSREYQVKAAFLYNFIQFVDWPEEKLADSNEPIIIGIIGKDPFGDAFEPIKDREIKGRKVVTKRFESFEKLKESAGKDKSESEQGIETLTKCHLLFICSSERKRLKEIINTVKDSGVLTVGEIGNFLEAGGIIRWFVEKKKIRFEINIVAAEQAGLKIRSKLLRLAERVIEEDASQENGGAESSWKARRTNYVYFAKCDNKT